MPKLAAHLLALCVVCTAQADPAPTHAIALTSQRDARDNQTTMASAALPLGESGWLEAAAGRSRSSEAGGARHATVLQLGAGRRFGTWQAGLSAGSRRDGQRLQQRDLQASLDWQGERFDAGMDLRHRDARLRDSVAGAPIAQRLKGPGVAVRGGARLGAARVYTALTRSRYRSQLTQAGNSASGGLLGTPLGAQPSLVTRDEAALSRSLLLGASWRFERMDLALESVNDQLLGQPGTLRSTQLKADIDLAPGWSLAPALGRTRDAQGGVNFGALALTRRW